MSERWPLLDEVLERSAAHAAEPLERVWVCSICGPSKHNRQTWCDLGCGRDYNQMTEMLLVPARRADQ